MKRVRPAVLALAALCGLAPAGVAQSSLEDALEQYSATSVRGYIKPLVDLFGANLNSGFFSGRAAPGGISIRFSLIGMASSVGEDQKTYTATTPPGFDPATFETATIFGGTGRTVNDANNPALQYRGSDGLINASLFPLAVPQLSVGGVLGTEAMVRFISTPTFGDNDEFPKTSLVGFGVRHNIGRYLGSALPVDLGVGAMYSTFKVGDIVKVTALIVGAQASKTVSALTVYGGAAWEKTTMNLTYTSTDPAASGAVDIDLDGANTFRVTAGLSLKLLVARIFADANLGSVTSFSGGLSFGN